MELSDIKQTFSVRCLNEKYVEYLAEDFKRNGFQLAYPISITVGGVMWDGNHRLEAARRAGLKEIPHVIETPENIRKAAHERNRVASNALPETFVDHAEEIWRMLSTGMTQQQVADELGWSREKVRNYSNLENISPVAWDALAREIQNGVPSGSDGAVPQFGTPVPFTENLLRNILDLTEYHQVAIVQDLISGAIHKGQVKNKCRAYRDREQFIEYAIQNLINNEDKGTFILDCLSGLYQSTNEIEKAIKHANEEYQRVNQVRIILGDSLIVMHDIEDESIDLLLTDPPYCILDESWDQFESEDRFLKWTDEWIRIACKKVKSSGRIYIFWSQAFMFRFPFNAVSDRFKFGNCLIWNYKNNIVPNDRRKYKYTYEPVFHFYGNEAEILNLPKNETWDESLNNYDVLTIAQPQSNFKDAKVHPAQKPTELISRIIQLGSHIGDTVLDPFAGSGTVGVSAKRLKRKAILIEQDDDYVKTALNRISKE